MRNHNELAITDTRSNIPFSPLPFYKYGGFPDQDNVIIIQQSVICNCIISSVKRVICNHIRLAITDSQSIRPLSPLTIYKYTSSIERDMVIKHSKRSYSAFTKFVKTICKLQVAIFYLLVQELFDIIYRTLRSAWTSHSKHFQHGVYSFQW